MKGEIMSEHAKEPWFVSGTGHLCSGDKVIPYDDLKQDARRIVACVNALQGVPTEQLEKAVEIGITDVSLGNLFSERLKLQQQRDTLLKQLKIMNDAFEARMGDCENADFHECFNDSVALIAEIEGKP